MPAHSLLCYRIGTDDILLIMSFSLREDQDVTELSGQAQILKERRIVEDWLGYMKEGPILLWDGIAVVLSGHVCLPIRRNTRRESE